MSRLKQLILSTLVAVTVLLSATVSAQWTWGTATNPTAGQVVCDSGAFTADMAGSAMIIVAANVATRFRFQLRDATNATTIREQYFYVAANGTQILQQPVASSEFDILTGQRLRIIVDAAVTGSVSCSMFHPF